MARGHDLGSGGAPADGIGDDGRRSSGKVRRGAAGAAERAGGSGVRVHLRATVAEARARASDGLPRAAVEE